jgi:hypothetical protein
LALGSCAMNSNCAGVSHEVDGFIVLYIGSDLVRLNYGSWVVG